MNGRPMGSVDAEETFRVRDKARRLNFKMRREKNLIIFTCLKIVKHGCNAAHSSQFHRHRLIYNGFRIYMDVLITYAVVRGEGLDGYPTNNETRRDRACLRPRCLSKSDMQKYSEGIFIRTYEPSFTSSSSSMSEAPLLSSPS